EVALACAVLMASSLLVRSVSRMLQAPTGVHAPGIVTATMNVPYAGYDWPKVDHGYHAVLETLRHEPGVVAAGATSALPLDPGWRLPFQIEGRAARTDDYSIAQHLCITDGYIEAIGATMIGGRTFTTDDRVDTEAVVVVNQT